MVDERLTDDELDGVVGGSLYVSIDGGDKIAADVSCKNGTMFLTFQLNGETMEYDTGVDLSGDNMLGTLEFAALSFVDSQRVINYTYKIDTDGEGLE